MTRDQQAVYVYVFEAGPPPYIAEEVFVPGRIVAELRADSSPWTDWHMVQETSTSQAVTREELLASADGRKALGCWEAKDAASSDLAYEADRRRGLEQILDRWRAEGCPTAAEILQRGAPLDEMDEYENSHNCEHDHPRLRIVR